MKIDNIYSLKIMNRKCPICYSENKQILYHIQMILPNGCGLPEEYDVVACDKCGFTFADVLANQLLYNEYYEKYNMYSESTFLKSSFDKELNKDRIELIEKYINKNDYVIDIGCGNGSLMKFLKNEDICTW
ncbi:MAG: hypothetical protein LKI76_06490 [Megasphaera sp.]|nr:hypothetical protein [Megasphaera sp.]